MGSQVVMPRLPMAQYRDFQPSVRFQPTLALSPDGKMVAYVDDENGQFNVVVRPVDGGPALRPTSFVDSTVRRVAWSPDGMHLVFHADTKGNENAQMYLVSPTEGMPEALTNAPSVRHQLAFGDPFSPDGSQLAYTANDRLPGQRDVLIRAMVSGEIRRIFMGGGGTHAGYWAPDGQSISVVDWRDSSEHEVYVVPADGGPARRLSSPEQPARYRLGPWLPDGSGFLVVTDRGREYRGLAVMHVDNGELTWLNTPDWNVEEQLALSQDGQVLIWTVNEGGASRLHARNLRSGENLKAPMLSTGVASEIATHDGRQVLMRLSTPTKPWNIAIATLGTGGTRWLTDATAIASGASAFIEPTLIHYPCRAGHRVPANLYRPASAAQPSPVVLAIHGGPMDQDRPVYEQDGFYQYLLHHGIAVMAPNIRGSSGYGRTYQESVYRDWGGVDLEDLADAVAYLRRQPWVDANRIGAIGYSYGAFLVLSCLARLPELNWAAGVSSCGPSNLVTLAQAAPPSWRSQVHTVIGNPDTDADRLQARSPITYADQICAPLFVVQGANDPRVPRQESDQIVQRLRKRGVEVRYDVYPDEGHMILKRHNQAKMRTDAGEFLIEHLTR